LSKGCRIVRVPKDDGWQHNRRVLSIARPNLEDLWDTFVHEDCVHNQITAIHNRVLGRVPEPNPVALARLTCAARRIGLELRGTTVDDYGVLPLHYRGAKRRRYEEATEAVLRYGCDKADSHIKMFIKCENIRYLQGPQKKINPDPRPIQFRDPKFMVEISRFLKPLEPLLYNLQGNRFNKLPPSRAIGKGLNQRERAELLAHKFDRFTSPIVVSIDAHRFDQHVSKGLLQVEHSVYLAANSDPTFQRLLSWQLRNTCYSTKGIKYVAEGRRMSGDANTALGNCLIMVLMVQDYFVGKGIKRWDLLDDGDDCLVLMEAKDYPEFALECDTHFLQFGMEVRVEAIAYDLEQVEWCQSRPVSLGDVRKFIRNPWKVLSSTLTSARWQQATTVNSRRKLLNSIGLCELVLNQGVPVLQAFASSLVRIAGTDKQARLSPSDNLTYRVEKEIGRKLGKIPKWKAIPITDEARDSFCKAFGIDHDAQRRFEAYFQSWTFSLDGYTELGKHIDVPMWILDENYPERAK